MEISKEVLLGIHAEAQLDRLNLEEKELLEDKILCRIELAAQEQKLKSLEGEFIRLKNESVILQWIGTVNLYSPVPAALKFFGASSIESAAAIQIVARSVDREIQYEKYRYLKLVEHLKLVQTWIDEIEQARKVFLS